MTNICSKNTFKELNICGLNILQTSPAVMLEVIMWEQNKIPQYFYLYVVLSVLSSHLLKSRNDAANKSLVVSITFQLCRAF